MTPASTSPRSGRPLWPGVGRPGRRRGCRPGRPSPAYQSPLAAFVPSSTAVSKYGPRLTPAPSMVDITERT
jgi:hypothetical protein